MTTDTNAPAAPDEQSFDELFAQAAAEAEGIVAAPPADPPASDPPATDPPATDPPAADPPAASDPPAGDPPANPPASDPPAAPPAPAAPAAPSAPPPEPPKETPEQIAAREAIEASIKPYEPSDDEKAALAKFKVDFPNEYLAVEAQFKAQKQAFNAQVYDAVQTIIKQMAPRIAAVETTATQTEIERHVAALHAAHSDYDEVIVKVPAWIKSQPAYLQPALQQVYDQGSTQDVIAMVADYKKATGAQPPAPPTPPAPPKPKPAGVDDLAPVSSRRVVTSPKGTPDPNDYDGAFREAAAALE